MATLRKQGWPLGYTPGANEYNGDANGLLVADNLTFDETGIVRLSKGTKLESSDSLTAAGEEIYSTIFDLNTLIDNSFPTRARVRYIGLANGIVVRNYGPSFKSLTDYEIGILSGGNSRFAFGSAFGHTLVFSGTEKFKDRGDTSLPLGIAAGPSPTVSPNVPPQVRADDPNASNFYSHWDNTATEGTGYNKASDSIFITTASLENLSRAIIQRGIDTTTTLNLDQLLPTGNGTSEDLFSFNLRLARSEFFVKVRVEYILATDPGVENYYWHEWTNRVTADITQSVDAFDFIPEDMTQEEIDALIVANTGVSFVSSIREGINVWTPLMCKRGEFNRVGSDDSLSWATVKGIRITYYTTEPMEILFNEARFIGGSTGQLTGEFYYIQQSLRDTNSYVEYGMPSPQTAVQVAYATSIHVTPQPLDFQANGFRIYRLSNATDGFYVIKQQLKQRIDSWTGTTITSPGHGLVTGNIVNIRDGYGAWAALSGTYTVTVLSPDTFGVSAGAPGGAIVGDMSFVNISPFDDFMSDAEALYGGSVNRLDRNKSLLPDDIIGMIAPYFGRVIYLTTKVIVPSEQNDPSRYDTRFAIENAADTGEVNLFINQVAERTIIVGTTKGFYVLSGDGTITDGVINFKLDGFGLKQPPINKAHCVYNGILYYLAADGWRFINGSESGLLTAPLRLLFPPWKEARHGNNPYRIEVDNGVKIAAVTVGAKAYFSMEQLETGRSLLIYDFVTQRYEYRRNSVNFANNPYALFVEDDGNILFTTSPDGDNKLRSLEQGQMYDNETIPQVFNLMTIFDDNNLPNNRKDALTLFLDIDSTSSLTIKLQGLREDLSFEEHVFTHAFTGRQRIALDGGIFAAPYKRYRLIVNGAVRIFKIFEYSLEYQERPIQVNFLRIPPSNYGVAGRKRIPEIPMLIDTLGNTVQFTPIIDNTSKVAVNFTKTDKDVFHHVFNEEQAGYVIGGTLRSITANGCFEFYELITPREIELLPDPLSYKHIPYTNLGNASRKRFIQFAFVIDTRGFNVKFTPYIDNVAFPSETYNTTRRQTVVYTFKTEAIGIDVGGILDSNVDYQKFEYFGIDLNECISEKLPPIARYYKVPCNNFGTASKKRIRTLPFTIDTKGKQVKFTPIVDGERYPPSFHTTTDKRTVLHFFETDVIGIDFCGIIEGDEPFEFYGMGKPESVEILPVAKLYDQIGPQELRRWGRIYKARVRIVPTGTSITYNLIVDCVSVANGTWQTDPNCEQILEIRFEKFVMGEIARLELQSTEPFHRLSAELLVRLTGNDTDNRWLSLEKYSAAPVTA